MFYPLADAVFFFLGVGFMEAVVKPLATRFFKKQISTHLSPALDFLDSRLPEMIGRKRGDEIEAALRDWLEIEQNIKTTQKEINYIFGIYDARVTADRALNHEQENSGQ